MEAGWKTVLAEAGWKSVCNCFVIVQRLCVNNVVYIVGMFCYIASARSSFALLIDDLKAICDAVALVAVVL